MTLDKETYKETLRLLQIELVHLLNDIVDNQRRVIIIFEGRDAAGKGSTIKRFIENLNPRHINLVALQKPSDVERGQWYFQRYIKTLPNQSELNLYDRSWYNRAVVEPVMGFCNKEQYEEFMMQVPEYEHMIRKDGIELIKFWLAIDREEQQERFDARASDPLKRWKLSPVDLEAQKNWDIFTQYIREMLNRTHTSEAPWSVVNANNKKKARLECIRHVIRTLDYERKGSTGVSMDPEFDIVQNFSPLTEIGN